MIVAQKVQKAMEGEDSQLDLDRVAEPGSVAARKAKGNREIAQVGAAGGGRRTAGRPLGTALRR